MSSLFSSWQILLTISILAYSFSTLLQRILLKNNTSDPIAYSIFFQLFTTVIMFIFALIHGFQIPNLLAFWPNILLMIILYAGLNILSFKSLHLIEASEYTVLFVTRAFWTILIAVLFLGEHISLVQILGTCLVLLGVIFVSYKKKKFSFNKGALYALLAAVFLGIAFANDAYIVRNMDVPSYEVFAFILPALLIMAMYPKSVGKMKSLFRPMILLKLFLFCTLYAVAVITIFFAYQVGHNVAELSALNQLSTILTVLLAIIFLKETSDFWKKVLGSFLAFVGAILIG